MKWFKITLFLISVTTINIYTSDIKNLLRPTNVNCAVQNQIHNESNRQLNDIFETVKTEFAIPDTDFMNLKKIIYQSINKVFDVLFHVHVDEKKILYHNIVDNIIINSNQEYLKIANTALKIIQDNSYQIPKRLQVIFEPQILSSNPTSSSIQQVHESLVSQLILNVDDMSKMLKIYPLDPYTLLQRMIEHEIAHIRLLHDVIYKTLTHHLTKRGIVEERLKSSEWYKKWLRHKELIACCDCAIQNEHAAFDSTLIFLKKHSLNPQEQLINYIALHLIEICEKQWNINVKKTLEEKYQFLMPSFNNLLELKNQLLPEKNNNNS